MQPPDPPNDAHSWRTAIFMVCGFTAVAMFYSVVVSPPFRDGGWYTSLDLSMLTTGGRAIYGGHFGQVYQDRNLYALPLSLFVMAPVAGLAAHIRLSGYSEPYRFLVYGPFITSFGVLTLHAARGLAWDLGVRSRLWRVQLVAVFLVLVPEFEWGHLEDVLALTFVLYALRLLLAADPVRASLLLSLAIASKQWAVMLIPVFVLATPAGRRLKAFLAACLLPALLIGVFMGFDFHDTFRNLTSPITDVKGATGHPWIDGTWLGARSSQANRSIALLLALAVSWRRRLRHHPFEVLGTVGLVLMVRPLTETVNYSYYWSPGLLILAMVAMCWPGHRSWRDWVWPVGAMAWTVPRSNDLTAMLWWGGEGVLLAMTALTVLGPGGFVDGLGRQLAAAGQGPPASRSEEMTPTR